MYQYAAKLVRVIDGDTVVMDLDLGFNEWRVGQPYRLARINAPEMPTAAGVASKEALAQRVNGVGAFVVATSKADKYGRWLAELYADNANVNDWLVANGHAVYRTY